MQSVKICSEEREKSAVALRIFTGLLLFVER